MIFLFLAVGPLRRALDSVGRMLPIPTRLAIVLGALVVASIAVGGIILDANIRKVVTATVATIVLYQVLARIGAWRWTRWDESERSIARRRSTAMFRRRTIWLEFLVLGSIAAAVALAIGLGRADLLRGTGVALLVLLGGFVIIDVVARKPTPAASSIPLPANEAPPASATDSLAAR